jgi:hypothetical protein
MPRCDSPCIVTDRSVESADEVCDDHARMLPPSLLKALVDPYDYALALRDGTVIRFNHAEISGDFAILFGDSQVADTPVKMFRPEGLATYQCPRGIDVRIADITWCADAPEGS